MVTIVMNELITSSFDIKIRFLSFRQKVFHIVFHFTPRDKLWIAFQKNLKIQTDLTLGKYISKVINTL